MKCVYCLEFKNGKKYVGSTKNLKQRLWNHRCSSNNKHNPKFRAAIDQGDYEVVILEQLPDNATKTDLLAREQHYYDLWFDSGILYNKSNKVIGSDGNLLRGVPKTPEQKAKMSAAKKGKKFTEEHKANISASVKGKKLSEEHKEKIRVGLRSPVWNHASEIKALRASGLTYVAIAKRYNCHFYTIAKICKS